MTRHLGKEQLTAANREAGEHGHEQGDHAHAAKPLRETPPEEQRPAVRGKIAQDRGAGRSQSRHRLEKRVDGTEAAPHVRDGGEPRDD
jgi:hypothetical protein